MTRRIVGVNPDYADFDELDIDALDIVAEFCGGTATFEELITLVGPEAAQAIREQMGGSGNELSGFFDDPENY